MIKFWVSLRLHVQLALASILVLSTTLAIVTWVNTGSARVDLVKDKREETSALTKSMAIFATHYVLNEKFDELEALLIEYANFPGMQDLRVMTANGQTISQVRKEETDEIVVVFDYPLNQIPQTINNVSSSEIDLETNSLIIWEPIKTSTLVGWVKAQVSLKTVDNIQGKTIASNIKSTIIAIITDILIIILILFNPARKMKRIVAFSKTLVEDPGKHLNFSGGSLEIDALVKTLNESSTKLHQQRSIISEKTELLENLASIDHLTKIPNRASFLATLDVAIKNAKRVKAKLIIVFIDLNDFKPINDTYGHHLGDKLLQDFATKLRGAVRETDTVGRYGGDEFVVLLTNIQGEDPSKKIVSNITDAVTGEYILEGKPFDISISLGLAIYPDNATTSVELLIESDHNMYKDKKEKKQKKAFMDRNSVVKIGSFTSDKKA